MRFRCCNVDAEATSKNADEGLRLARESNEIRIKLALIEIGTEFRVMAQHLERDPRSPSQPRRLRLPGEVILGLRSEKLKADQIKRSAETPLGGCGLPPGSWTARLGREKANHLRSTRRTVGLRMRALERGSPSPSGRAAPDVMRSLPI
jgi:hypothetical protein